MMVQFLRKLFGQWFHQHSVQAPSDKEETDLEQFFTDNDYARHVFNDLISTTPLPRRILIIHGIGSVGKSTLLIMYHLTCQKRRIAVVLVRGEEVKSSVDVLRTWANDLTSDNITLPTFQSTLNH